MKTPLKLPGSIVIAMLVGPALSFTASAVPVLFNLRDTLATAEIVGGTITRSGIIATLTPVVQGATGVLHQTAGSFGVNAFSTLDTTSQLDNAGGTESISMIFNVDVTWNSLVVSSFGAGDQGSLTIASFAPTLITTTGTQSWSTNNLVLAGQPVVIRQVSGAFSFDSFTVERTTAVPDAGSSLLLLFMSLGGLGIIARRSGS